MAVTFRQLMNRVLNNLGESEIPSATTAISSNYHKLLRNILNQVKEEVEDAHTWRSLRSVETITIAAGANSAIITNGNERTRLVRLQEPQFGEERALVFDVTTATAPKRIREIDLNFLLYKREQDGDQSANDPASYFAVDQKTTGTLYMEVFPLSVLAQSMEATMIIPQARYEGDSGDIDTAIEIPTMPLEMGMTYFALLERGEELGPNSLFSRERFDDATDRAIARDAGESGDFNLVPV